ncbi:MAG: PAS domain S-box protein [Verrucomicrobiales bacterium]|nr:PAS domain S-box protein [Verrucomicrobiales bacterium]
MPKQALSGKDERGRGTLRHPFRIARSSVADDEWVWRVDLEADFGHFNGKVRRMADAKGESTGIGRLSGHLVLFVVGYFLSAALANWMSRGAGSTLVFWLPSGVSLAALLWREPRQWPWFMAAALLSNGILDLAYGKPVLVSAWVSLGNVAEAVVGAWMVRRWVGQCPDLSKPRDLVGLAGYGGLLAPILSATVGTWAMRAVRPEMDWMPVWVSWWLGAAMGVVVAAPAILCFRVPSTVHADWRRVPVLLEAVSVLVLTALLASETSRIEAAGAPGMRFLLFPVIGWAAFRFGTRGAALATVVAAVSAAWSLREALGRIAVPSQGWPSLWLAVHGGLIIAGFTGLLLAALFAEGRRRESELRANRHRLEAIIDACPMALIAVDREYRVRLWNPAATALLGWSAVEVLGMPAPFVAREDVEEMKNRVDRLMAGVTYEGVDRRYVRKDGTRVDTRLWTVPLRSADGSIHSTLALVLDVTQLHRTQEALRESAHRFDSLIESTHAGYFFLDLEGRYRQVNAAWLRMHGLATAEEILGRHFSATQTSESLEYAKEVVQRMLSGEGGISGESERRRPDGTVGHHMFSANAVVKGGAIVGVEGVLIDTTERRRLEERLRQAQKLEAIGQLAGGVAHDFNNILAATLIHLGLLKADATLAPEARETVDELKAEVLRGAEVVRQLLAFGRRSMLVRRPIELNQVISGMRRMLERLLGEQVRCEFALAPSLPAIEADSGMMEQVVMNLAVNARDAMPSGGLLRLSTSRVVSRARGDAGELAEPRLCVCLEVSDTGCGMEESTIRHIFEPFFTTKEVGKGTGLGLSTVYGIVRQHQGWLEVNSQPGSGSTFRVYLPAVDASPAVPAPTPSTPPVEGGSETLLVVEDDAHLRRLLAVSLCRAGYRVIEAPTGKEALEAWKARKAPIDLVFSDVVMPDGISGSELVRILREEDPDLPVILTSGYSAELVQEGAPIQQGVMFVQKPLDLSQLHATVRQALESRLRSV